MMQNERMIAMNTDREPNDSKPSEPSSGEAPVQPLDPPDNEGTGSAEPTTNSDW